MRSVWLLALTTIGCRSILGFDDPITVTDDASGPSCETWHPQGFDPCALGAPMPALHLRPGEYVYDTTISGGRLFDSDRHVLFESKLTLTQPDQSEIAVLSVNALAIDAGATVSTIGFKPLLVVAWSTITVDGAIDAGSHVGVTDAPVHTARTVQFGAGANQACGVNTGGDGSAAISTAGSNGGGGGGFQGAGGAGARGAGASPPGGAGGAVVPALVIRGGCPGGPSGTAGPSATPPATQGSHALGGAGGGAIRLVAYDSITVEGSVSANGAGGAGAPQNSACGGGGGGSGGYVAFEAPYVAIGASGIVTANGGGGGGGGGANDFGHEGSDGKIDLQVAPGGAVSSSGCGQAGGAGSLATQIGGADALVAGVCGGGGGGGGAAGFIILASANVTVPGTAQLSPPPLRQ
jgi:hypothetical protein